jgi:proliferating cell nuclear antigen
MFEARLAKTIPFKKIISASQDVIKIGYFEISPTGLFMQGMDKGKLVIVALNLKENAFESYRCDNNLSIGMDIQVLSKMLKGIEDDKVITLKASDQGETATIFAQDQSKEKISDFAIKLVESDGEQLNIPDDGYTSTVKLSSSELLRIVKDLASIGETVTINVTENFVKFSTSGDFGSSSITLKSKESPDKPDEEVKIKADSQISQDYPSKLLSSIVKASFLCSHVTLYQKEESPIALEYKLGNSGEIRFFLAPRLKEDVIGVGDLSDYENGDGFQGNVDDEVVTNLRDESDDGL